MGAIALMSSFLELKQESQIYSPNLFPKSIPQIYSPNLFPKSIPQIYSMEKIGQPRLGSERAQVFGSILISPLISIPEPLGG
jgi:hypothetical protein